MGAPNSDPPGHFLTEDIAVQYNKAPLTQLGDPT
jgi:hypothetical protein